jgi:hypothetical protein
MSCPFAKQSQSQSQAGQGMQFSFEPQASQYGSQYSGAQSPRRQAQSPGRQAQYVGKQAQYEGKQMPFMGKPVPYSGAGAGFPKSEMFDMMMKHKLEHKIRKLQQVKEKLGRLHEKCEFFKAKLQEIVEKLQKLSDKIDASGGASPEEYEMLKFMTMKFHHVKDMLEFKMALKQAYELRYKQIATALELMKKAHE